VQASPHTSCSTTAGFQFTVTGGWHSALAGVMASIVFVAIVFVLTNAPEAEDHRHDRGPSLRILFVTFFVFLVASFLWATVAGFPMKSVGDTATAGVAVAVQPVLAVPAAWLLSIGAALLFFAIAWLVWAYADRRDLEDGLATTAVRCFRLIGWLTAVEVWIAIETATRALAGRGWWYAPTGILIVGIVSVPFLFADRLTDRVPAAGPDRWGRTALRDALGFTGASAVAMVALFAIVTGQPEASVFQEGHWCGQGLPWWAAIVALGTMALYLAAVASLARALPRAPATKH
jgi:hypothetical protein